jgi:hypothetical protein
MKGMGCAFIIKISLAVLAFMSGISSRDATKAASSEIAGSSPSVNIIQRVKSALIAGLIGDALALGGHYEYDARKIKASGGYKDFSPPGEANNGVGWGTANYHPGKKAGDLTDAGDIVIMLLEHLSDLAKKSELHTYSFMSFAQHWQKEIQEHGYGSCNFQSVGRSAKSCPPGARPGYINGGSRRTLENLASMAQSGGGSAQLAEQNRKYLAADVNCLVAATHFLPLFLVMSDEESLVKAAKDTVYLSHKNQDPLAAAEFLCRALYRIIYEDEDVESALIKAAEVVNNPLISKWLDDAKMKVHEATGA